MADTGELEVDMLFLGLTRPPMFFGVSYIIVMMNFLSCMTYYVIFTDGKAFLAMPIIHGVAYVLSQKEPLFMELFKIRMQKCNKCKNRLYHGMTNSYDVR